MPTLCFCLAVKSLCLGGLLVPHVRDTLKEQETKDVTLPISCIDRRYA